MNFINTVSEKGPLNACLYGPINSSRITMHYSSNKLVSSNVCYEITWNDGDGSLCFGFISETQQTIIYFFKFGDPCIVYTDFNRSYEIHREPTSFIIEKGTPILVCISLEERKFTLIQNDQSHQNTFVNEFNPERAGVNMHPGASNKKDFVTVNFGSSAFSNHLPDGYLPFSIEDKCTKRVNIYNTRFFYAYVYILFIAIHL